MKKLAVVLALLISFSAGTAHAGGVSVDTSLVLDRWTFKIGGFLTGLDTNIRLDSPNDRFGTTINLEDDLGFSSSESVPRLNLGFILGKRHRFMAGWYKTDRDSSTTLRQEIDWGDETFPINLDVRAFYNTEFINFAYTYWFYSSEKTALGVTGGLVFASIAAGLEASAIGQGIEAEEDLSTDIPVPQFGFSVNTYLGRRFVFTGSLVYIAFDLDDWEGDVATARAGIEHRTWKNFGFGLAYGYSSYDIDANASEFLGTFEYTIDGFEIYFRAAW